MNIIQQNFFVLLHTGAFGRENGPLEPMSLYKWNRLFQIIKEQNVASYALKGTRGHQYDPLVKIPKEFIDNLTKCAEQEQDNAEPPILTNYFLGRRLKNIQENERHTMDASMDTLQLLNIIVSNVSGMLNRGFPLRGIIKLGSFLRNQGDKVDFLKLEKWLKTLHLQRLAQLEGSILMEKFKFEKAEIPFVHEEEPAARKLLERSINHTAMDTAEEWHFRQSRSGFVHNNTTVLRKNLRRSMRYIGYAPLETISNFIHNFTRSLSEIEE